MNDYGISYDHSMVIDRDGIIRYSNGGVNLSAIQSKIDELLSTSIEDNGPLPFTFGLYNNYPNPFNPETTIHFSVDAVQKINLNIFDVRGRLLRKLVDSEMGTGTYTMRWDGTDQSGLPVSSGVYFYQLTGEKNRMIRKMQLIR